MELETALFQAEQGEQSVHRRPLIADVEAGNTASVKPDAAHATNGLDPELSRLGGDGEKRQDIWQCNCLKCTFKRHGNLRFLWRLLRHLRPRS